MSKQNFELDDLRVVLESMETLGIHQFSVEFLRKSLDKVSRSKTHPPVYEDDYFLPGLELSVLR